jgi:hypothetical protein
MIGRFVVFFLLIHLGLQAQFAQLARPILDSLCSPRFAGRGYLQDGVNISSLYLANQFDKIGLNSFDGDFFQTYMLPVNTIQKTNVQLDKRLLQPGSEYLVEADCPSITGTYKMLPVNVSSEVDRQLLLSRISNGLHENEVILFKHAEDRVNLKIIKDTIAQLGLKVPLYIYSSSKKLLWTVADEVSRQAAITIPDTIINEADEISVDIQSKFISRYPCRNIVGYIPAKKKKVKEYIVFSAHYDHLGMMGEQAYFPGASDNASGVSMILNLAKYFSENRIEYKHIVFILFSGEEAGLMGSAHYIQNPLFPLKQIKALINIDIMGNAEAGITVVNGEKEKKIFDHLLEINKDKKYLPEIKIRGKAANSDHHYFSEIGVPAIFIYSNGGVGYYHDVWDKPNTINLANYDQVAQLLIDFVKSGSR